MVAPRRASVPSGSGLGSSPSLWEGDLPNALSDTFTGSTPRKPVKPRLMVNPRVKVDTNSPRTYSSSSSSARSASFTLFGSPLSCSSAPFTPKSCRSPYTFDGASGASSSECRNELDSDCDPLGDEMSSNAKVWRTYSEESSSADATMTDGWNRSLDVLLIFAGLFSAVLTSFTTESYKLLQQDSTNVSNKLLLDISLSLRELLGDQRISDHKSTHPWTKSESAFSPPRSAVWLNGLWFASLTASLLVSVVAMLAKQWLHAYCADLPMYPHERSRVRQYRHDGILKWRLCTIISMLPMLLHISLGLFLAGLVMFLWSLHPGIGISMLVMLCLVSVFYCISTALPLIYPECPFRTPLTSELGGGLRLMNSAIGRLADSLHVYWPFASKPRFKARGPTATPSNGDADSERELGEVLEIGPQLDNRAIAWLLRKTRNQPSVEIAAKSIAGLQTRRVSAEVLVYAGALNIICEKLVACFVARNRLRDDAKSSAALYCRAMVQLLGTVKPTEQYLTSGLRDTLVCPLRALCQYPEPDLATTAKCAWAILEFSSGNASEDELSELLQCIHDFLDDKQTHFNISNITLCLLFSTLSSCFGKLRDESREAVKIEAIPMFIELAPLVDAPGPLVREKVVQTLAHLVLGDDCHVGGKVHGDEEPKDPTRVLIRSLAAILKYPVQLGVSDEHIKMAAWQLFEIVDCRKIAIMQADYFDFDILMEVGAALISCLSAARSPSKPLLKSAIPVVCAAGYSFTGCVSVDPKYTLSVANFLARTMAKDTVDMILTGGGFSFLVRHMDSVVPGVAEICTDAVKVALEHVEESGRKEMWELVEASGLMYSLRNVLSSTDLGLEELVSWAGPIIRVAPLAEAAERCGLLPKLTQALARGGIF